MGCQNSKLSLISSQNKQAKIQPVKREQIDKPKSKSKIYQCNQSTTSQEEISSRGKENIPQTIQILTNEKSNAQSLRVTKEQLQMVSDVIEKIEEFQQLEKRNRKQYQIKSKTKVDFEDYFKQILKMFKKRKNTFQKIIQQASNKYTSHFGKKLTNEDINQLVQDYLSKNVVPYFEAQKWIKQKLVILRIKGQYFVKWTNEICSNWKQDKQYIPQLLQVLIQDLLPSDKSFSIKLAIDYEFKEIMEELKEWQIETSQIYSKLKV